MRSLRLVDFGVFTPRVIYGLAMLGIVRVTVPVATGPKLPRRHDTR